MNHRKIAYWVITMKVFKQQIRKLSASRRTLLLIELLNAIKMNVLRIIGKLHAKNQGPYSKDEKVISFFSPFSRRDRQADIVAYRDNVSKGIS